MPNSSKSFQMQLKGNRDVAVFIYVSYKLYDHGTMRQLFRSWFKTE